MTVTALDLGIHDLVDLEATPVCESGRCDRSAEVVLRFTCGGHHVLSCQPCFGNTERKIDLMEVTALCRGGNEITWSCPVCGSTNRALLPELRPQIIAAVTPL